MFSQWIWSIVSTFESIRLSGMIVKHIWPPNHFIGALIKYLSKIIWIMTIVPARCIISLILLMHRDGQNSAKYYASRWASIKIHIIFDKYLIRARMKSLGGQICFTIIPDSLIDSIVETINHIHISIWYRRLFGRI